MQYMHVLLWSKQYLLSLHEDLLLRDYQLNLEILSDLIRHAVYSKTSTHTRITYILFTYCILTVGAIKA